MAFRRKQRDLNELQADPHFPFYVGRLMGAAEMVSHWLTLQEAPEAIEMGNRLGVVVGWFLMDEPEEVETKILIPPKP